MFWMLKNSKGHKDSMLTFASIGCVSTVLAIISSIFSGSEITLGSVKLQIHGADATIVSAFLGATLLAYCNRRNAKDNAEFEKEKIILKQQSCLDCKNEKEVV